MNEIIYFLVKFGSAPRHLMKRESGRFWSLARQDDIGWILHPKDCILGGQFDNGEELPEITEEEAAMILFQAKEQA